jgi:hypothetical protein
MTFSLKQALLDAIFPPLPGENEFEAAEKKSMRKCDQSEKAYAASLRAMDV